MTAIIEMLRHFDVSSGVLMGLVDATLKATVILAIAAILVVALRRAAARHRHAMLAVAICSVLVVPVLSGVMPRYRVPLLPGPSLEPSSAQRMDAPVAGAQARSIERAAQRGEPAFEFAAASESAGESAVGLDEPAGASRGPVSVAAVTTPARSAQPTNSITETGYVAPQIGHVAIVEEASPGATTRVSISFVLVAVWAAGMCGGLLWMMLGTMRVTRWMRSGLTVEDVRARRVARQVTQGLGLRRHVALIETDAIDSPMTWGALRPVVLLPLSWREWTTERLRIVLLHELMHVRRNDWFVQMVARLACVVHWFNPLVWFVCRRLEEIRELACDDDVVDIGTRPSTYAETLLEMATRMRRRPMIAAVALNMAARTRLEGRVISILGRGRGGARRGFVLQSALVGLAGCALILSAVEPWQSEESLLRPASPDRLSLDAPNETMNATPTVTAQRDKMETRAASRYASAVGAWRSDLAPGRRALPDDAAIVFASDAPPATLSPVDAPVSQTPMTGDDGGRGRLIDRADAERQLLWRQAVAKYHEVERAVRQSVLAQDFEAVRRDTDRAAQIIEAARPYAPNAGEFDAQRKTAAGLRAYVEDEERRFHEDRIRALQAEVEAHIKDEANAKHTSKDRIIAQLADRADELAKAKRYDEAVQVLDQLLLIDPENEKALWMRDRLDDLRHATDARDAVRARHDQTRDLLIANDWDGVPYDDDMRYPDDWPEKKSRRRSTDELREPESTRKTRLTLRTAAPEIRFDAMEFADVIDRLRALTGLNFVPNWAALEAVAIEKDAEVSLQLNDVSYQKVLELVLAEVSGGEVDLGYEIDEGIIRISTKEDLSRRTQVVSYDVRDLIISVPNFRGPRIEINQIGQNNQQQGGIGGGRFIEGGGGGGQGGGGQNLFQDDGNEEDDEEVDDPLQPLIDLIQATIEPESWREAGGNVGSISTLNQMIVVTQTSSAHQQLQDLLRKQ